MLVVDMLHEFELGVWKAIFTHLMRIAHAAGGNAVKNLNWRYVFSIYQSLLTTGLSTTGTVVFRHSGEEQSGASTGMHLQ